MKFKSYIFFVITIIFLLSYHFIKKEAMPKANFPFIYIKKKIETPNDKVKFKEKISKVTNDIKGKDLLVTFDDNYANGIISFDYSSNIQEKLNYLRKSYPEKLGYDVNTLSNRDTVYSSYITTPTKHSLNTIISEFKKKVATIDNLKINSIIYTRVNKLDGAKISLGVKKEENIKTINQLKDLLESDLIKKNHGENITSFDLSHYYNISNNSLKSNILWILGILTLLIYIFYKDIKLTLSLLLLFPLTLMINIIIFQLLGISINVISLTGIALSLGVLVDNYILTTDNLVFKKKKDVKKILFISNITTLSVLLPIFIKNSFISQLFGDIAFSLSISILVSYVLSIILLPRFIDTSVVLTKPLINTLNKKYKIITEKIQFKNIKIVTTSIFIIFLITSGYIFTKVPINIFPTITTGRFTVSLNEENNSVEKYLINLPNIMYVEKRENNYFARIDDKGEERNTINLIEKVKNDLINKGIKNFEVNEGNNTDGDLRKISLEFTDRVSINKRNIILKKLKTLHNISNIKSSSLEKYFNKNKIFTYSISVSNFNQRNQTKHDIRNILNSMGLKKNKDYSYDFNMNPTKNFGQIILFSVGVSLILLLSIFIFYMKSIKKVLLVSLFLCFTTAVSGIGLKIFNFDLDIFAMVGLVVSLGISINNFIIILENSKAKDSIYYGCYESFGTILFTTLTTTLSLVPFMISQTAGSLFYNGLAVTIGFGSFGAFLASLIFFPLMFSTFSKID